MSEKVPTISDKSNDCEVCGRDRDDACICQWTKKRLGKSGCEDREARDGASPALPVAGSSPASPSSSPFQIGDYVETTLGKIRGTVVRVGASAKGGTTTFRNNDGEYTWLTDVLTLVSRASPGVADVEKVMGEKTVRDALKAALDERDAARKERAAIAKCCDENAILATRNAFERDEARATIAKLNAALRESERQRDDARKNSNYWQDCYISANKERNEAHRLLAAKEAKS